jgi:hypothetical protein
VVDRTFAAAARSEQLKQRTLFFLFIYFSRKYSIDGMCSQVSRKAAERLDFVPGYWPETPWLVLLRYSSVIKWTSHSTSTLSSETRISKQSL